MAYEGRGREWEKEWEELWGKGGEARIEDEGMERTKTEKWVESAGVDM